MGLIFKEINDKIYVYHKVGRKWKSLGTWNHVHDVFMLFREHPKNAKVIIKTLKLTQPNLGEFIESLGRNRFKWFENEWKIKRNKFLSDIYNIKPTP